MTGAGLRESPEGAGVAVVTGLVFTSVQPVAAAFFAFGVGSLTVALGASAARSLTGKTLTISNVRDAPLTLADGGECWVTVHPSYLLRLPNPDARRTERARFVEDLKRIRDRAEALAA